MKKATIARIWRIRALPSYWENIPAMSRFARAGPHAQSVQVLRIVSST